MRPFLDRIGGRISALIAFIAVLIAALCSWAPAQANTHQLESINQSVVFVRTVYPTVVGVPWDDGSGNKNIKPYPFTQGEISGRCSGSIITATGYVLTAAHCIQPGESMDKAAVEATKRAIIAEGFSLGDNPDIESWQISYGQPTVTVDQPQRDQQSAFARGELQARIVDAQQPETGDNALLQLQGVSDLVPLPIASTKPAVGESVKSFGFPLLTDAETNPKLQDPTFRSLTITRHTTTEKYATPVFEVDGEILGGMSGGPVVNANGETVGVNSRGFTSMSVSYVTDTDDMNQFLRGNGVDSVAGTSTGAGAGSEPVTSTPSGGPLGPVVAPDDNTTDTSADTADADGVSASTWVIVGLVAVIVILLLVLVVLPKYKQRSSSAGQSRPTRDNDNNTSV